MASRPVPTATTSAPSAWRRTVKTSRISGASSTTRIRKPLNVMTRRARRDKKQVKCQRRLLYWHSVTSGVNAAFTASVLDGLGEAVFVTDDQLRIVAWNSVMERHTGLARSEVMGRPAPALLRVLGEQSEARLATWRTADDEIGGVMVSIPPAAARRREDRFLRAVEAIGHSLASSSDVTSVLDTVAATAMEVMAAESALVVGWDGEGSVFDVVSVVGRLSTSYAPGGRIPMARGPLGSATIEGRTIVTQDILNDPDVALSLERAERVAREGFRAVVASPVVAKGVVHGALAAYYWSARSFTD